MPTAVLLGYDPEQPSFRHRMRSLIARSKQPEAVRAERFPSGRTDFEPGSADATARGGRSGASPDKIDCDRGPFVCRLYAAAEFLTSTMPSNVRKPRRLGEAPTIPWRKRKFAATCRWVDVVAAGNDVLAGSRVPRRDPSRFCRPRSTLRCISRRRRRRRSADRRVSRQSGEPDLFGDDPTFLGASRRALPTLKLRVICSRFRNWPEVNIEGIAWTRRTEAQSLAGRTSRGHAAFYGDAWVSRQVRIS